MNNLRNDLIQQNSFDPFIPAEIASRIEAAGVVKANLSVEKLIILGLLGGLYIAFGGALATLILTENNLGFGLGRFSAGIAFSLGLIMLVIGGGELFTGNNLMVVAWAKRGISWAAALRNWMLVYPANAAGAVALAFLIQFTGILDIGSLKATAINIAEAKAQISSSEAFTRGLLCNVLVCLAIWLSTAARSVSGKAVVIMLPVGAFVALGFEHCIANFYLIPIGMLVGAQIELADFFSNIAVVTAGNTLGGIIVALAYSCIYVRSASGVDEYTKQKGSGLLVCNPMRFAMGCGIGVVSAALLAYEFGGF